MPPDGRFGDFGGGPSPWFGLLFFGLQSLFWLALIGAAIWGLARAFGARRLNAAPQMMAEIADPSAVELLRRRYVMGEIDADTFEAMMERVLASEERERSKQFML